MKKSCYKEILRLLALFWVIYNHTWTYGWIRYTELSSLRSFDAVHNLFLHEFCKIGVPLFLLISGSNLVGKEESLKDLFKKRIFRFLVVIVALHYAVYVVYLYNGATVRHNWKELLISLYSDTTFCPYYFYMYIAFLLILPMLRLIAKNRTVGLYTIGLMIFIGIFPMSLLETFLMKPANNLIEYIPYSSIVVYPLAGYYLDRIEEEKYNRVMWSMGLAGLIMLIVAMLLDARWFNTYGTHTEYGRYAFFLSCFIYLAVKKLCVITKIDDKLSPLVSKILFTISGATMLAFVISGTAFWKLVWIYDRLAPHMNKDIACEILVWATFIVSLVLGMIIRLIPGVKKYV